MSKDYSEARFFRFLDDLSAKGLLKKPTARARRAASKQLLSILKEHEKQDLSSIDADAIIDRFASLQGQRYSPASLRSYQSRFKAAREDFLRYTENPSDFKPAVTQRIGRSSEAHSADGSGMRRVRRVVVTPEHAPPRQNGLVFPVPIRADVTVEIKNIPADFTAAEAAKVAGVIKALAAIEADQSKKLRAEEVRKEIV